MSTRDELAADLFKHLPTWLRVDRMTTGVDLADALIAEGWRKKPSREEVVTALASARARWLGTMTEEPETEWLARAILALMDRGQ